MPQYEVQEERLAVIILSGVGIKKEIPEWGESLRSSSSDLAGVFGLIVTSVHH
jgi:hypothetical protein